MSSLANELASKRDNHTPSCSVCQRRKVKCDRVYPCGPCQKTRLQCEFKPASQHGRKRVKRTHSIEEEAPLDPRITNGGPSAEPAGTPPQGQTARLVSENGGYRYVNNHLWSALSTQAESGASPTATITPGRTPSLNATVAGPEGVSGHSIYESVLQESNTVAGRPGTNAGAHLGSNFFLFGHSDDRSWPNHTPTAATSQPPASHVVQLWQTYLTNVDPMLKAFHAPSMQQTVLGSIGKSQLPPNTRALTSAIYFISVASLREDECNALLQTSREVLLRTYRDVTQDALSAADFVRTTDIGVLQAFVLYLVALRSLGETNLVWPMTGLAIRIAGTIGLARDGSMLGLPPFECEVRRRLFWALTYLDARTAELVGQDGDLLVQKYDVHLPANLNDTQLFPDMQRLPESRPAATEVAYILLRAMLASYLNSLPSSTGPASTWQRMRATNIAVSEKASIVESLERRLEEEILRFCDPTVPLQAMTINAARTLLTKLRLVGNIPSHGRSAGPEHPNGSSDNLFELSMQMMQLQLDLFGNASLQKWRWHWQGVFQWYAIAELIRQTRLRQPGPATTKAWSIIRKVFDTIIPTLELAPRQSPLLDAVRAMFHAAANHQDQTNDQTRARSLPATATAASPQAQPITPASNDSGAKPHSAMLPGMGSGTPAVDTGGMNMAGYDDFGFGFDYDAIDWDEFDRLTAELCRQ